MIEGFQSSFLHLDKSCDSYVIVPKPLFVLSPFMSSVVHSSFSQDVLLTGGVLESLTCGEGGDSELNTILSVPEKQQSLLRAYQTAMCEGVGGGKSERFAQISQELRDQIDMQRIIEKVQRVMNTPFLAIRLLSVYLSVQLFVYLISPSVYLYLFPILFINLCLLLIDPFI